MKEKELFEPPKFIKFPSDLKGVRCVNGKEQIKLMCSDGEYHWVNYDRYKQSRWKPVFKLEEVNVQERSEKMRTLGRMSNLYSEPKLSGKYF